MSLKVSLSEPFDGLRSGFDEALLRAFLATRKARGDMIKLLNNSVLTPKCKNPVTKNDMPASYSNTQQSILNKLKV